MAQELLRRLVEGGVRFVIVGGVALVARGGGRSTEDLDIAYARDRDNLRRLSTVLAPLHPRLRGVPEGLPFELDESTLRLGLNFTLDTDLGPLDLFGELPGIGSFERVDAAASELVIGGVAVLALTLDGLEASKRAAGRPKDLLDLGLIRGLRDALREGEGR
jgi:hypothetical protein